MTKMFNEHFGLDQKEENLSIKKLILHNIFASLPDKYYRYVDMPTMAFQAGAVSFIVKTTPGD